ncbi:hypothetical protein A2U01_0102648 [Trifolium medium]|uniref:Uncharacterized protein n=1 Tax=Trifolium medium TaxID=97028 RepID=A0A392V346_9FABA|nr:hypothetical protein [Trifolium medium]
MVATVKPKEDKPMTDSIPLADDVVIVRFDQDRDSFHHDSCWSHRVRWWCSDFDRHECEESWEN